MTQMLLQGLLCGAAASGEFHWSVVDVAKSLTCMGLSGPLLTGYTQTLNDYEDREIDAINEPNRPIPSGISPISIHGHERISWFSIPPCADAGSCAS